MAGWFPSLGTEVRVETMSGAIGENPNQKNDTCGTPGDGPLRDTLEQFRERSATYMRAASIFKEIARKAEEYGGF